MSGDRVPASPRRFVPKATTATKAATIIATTGAALLGVLQGLSIATPWDGQPSAVLQVLSLSGMVLLLSRTHRSRDAFALGWLFATAWLCSVFWWLFISMNTYGHLPAWLSALAVLLLAAFLATNYAVAAACWQRGWMRGGLLRSTVGFAALWTLAELARGWLWTGFPWGASGYAHVDGWLGHWAPWVGVYGVGALAAALAAVLARLMSAPSPAPLSAPLPAPLPAPLSARSLVPSRTAAWQAALVVLPAVTAGAWLPAQHSREAGSIDVTLLQGNISQDQKFRASGGIAVALGWYPEQLLSVDAGLVVAPETAIPLLPAQWPPALRERLSAHFAQPQRAALIGVPLGDASGYANSVIALGASDAGYRYDKHHLVPFGEFVPPLFRWFTEAMRIPLGEFNAGAAVQPALHWMGQRIAPNVCYEDLFGEELARGFADAAQAPTLMVNFSNIAWFGNTIAVDQHLQIARMRSLELQRAMVRATNTGATVIIDHHARVTHSVAPHTRAVLRGSVQGREGNTPYASWASRWGLLPLALGCVALLTASRSRTDRPKARGMAEPAP